MSNMKLATSSKQRQPNHIISCGGIISSKATDAALSNPIFFNPSILEMDMNAIIKKLAVRKSDMNTQQQ